MRDLTQCMMQSGDEAGLLLDYCAGRLSGEREEAMRRHVAVCASCREVVAGQQALWNALDGWDAPEVSPGFDRALAQRIEAAEAAPFYVRWLERFSWKPALSAAAVAAAVLAVAVLRTPDVVPVAPETEVADVEKLEQALEDIEILTVLNTAGQPARM